MDTPEGGVAKDERQEDKRQVDVRQLHVGRKKPLKGWENAPRIFLPDIGTTKAGDQEHSHRDQKSFRRSARTGSIPAFDQIAILGRTR